MALIGYTIDMTNAKLQVKKFLNKLKIPYRWTEHAAVFTVEESLELIEDKEPVKSLFLKGKDGQFFLVIISGAKRLNTKDLAGKLGSKKLSFAKSEDLKKFLGVEPGSASLFGLIYDPENRVKLVIETRLLSVKELGFHPNDNTATVYIKPSDLKKIAQNLDHDINFIEL